MSSIITIELLIICLHDISYIVFYNIRLDPSYTYLLLTFLSYKLIILVFFKTFIDKG